MHPPAPSTRLPGAAPGRLRAILLRAVLLHEHVRGAAVLLALLAVFFWEPLRCFGEVHYSPADTSQIDTLTRLEAGHRPGNQLQSDAVTQMEPWLMFNRSELAAGRFPLWNPHNGAGCPHFANYQSAVLSPFSLPYYVLGFRAALLVSALLKLFLLGFFTYLFLRRLRLAWIPALAGGAAFMFAGHNVLLLYFPHVGALCVMPIGLYCAEVALQRLERALDSGGIARAALPLAGLALAITAGLLAGNPEPFYFGAVLLLVWTAARLGRLAWRLRGAAGAQRASAGGQGAVLRFAGKLALAGAIGVGLAAVQLLPFFEYLQQSRVYEQRSSVQTPLDPRWWPLALFPNVLGSPSAPYFVSFDLPSPDYELVNMQYTGGLATFLFLAAIALAWRDHRARFFAGAGLVWLVYAHDAGGAWKLFAWIPSVAIAPINRSQGVWSFLVCCAAALAIDRLMAGAGKRRWITAGGLCVAASAFVIACLMGAERIIEEHANVQTPYVDQFRGYVPAHVASMTWAFALGAAACAALLLVRSRAWRQALAAVASCALFAQSGFLLRSYNPVCEDRFFFPRTPAVSELQRLVGHERLAVLGEDMLPPDSNLAYGLDLLQSYDGMWVHDLDRLYRVRFGDGNNWRPITMGRERDLRLFGTRWVLHKWLWNFLDSGLQDFPKAGNQVPIRHPIVRQRDVTQTFRARSDGLQAVMVVLSARPGATPAPVQFRLVDLESGATIATGERTAERIRESVDSLQDTPRPGEYLLLPHGRPVVFRFPPVAGSRGRHYEIRLSSDEPGAGVAIWAWSLPMNGYGEGQARVADVALTGELLFDFSFTLDRYEEVARFGSFTLARLLSPTGEFNVVRGVTVARDLADALARMNEYDFDPRHHAIVCVGPHDGPAIRLEAALAALPRRRLVQFEDSDHCFLVSPDGRELAHIDDELTFVQNGLRWKELEKLPASERSKFHVIPDSDLAGKSRAGLVPADRGAEPATGLEVLERTPTRARVAVDSPVHDWLVWSQAHYPGWKAWVNGVETPIFRAKGAFDAVLLPPGRAEVEFRYEPESVRDGLWISALSALAGILGLTLESRRRRAA